VQAENKISDVFNTVKAGGALDAGTVKTAVTRMSESIMRNPDALMLFSALKQRGGYFLDRAMNCSIYLITFTRFLGMEQSDIERAGMVGMSQDVGMLGLPEAVLQKPGPLSPDEITLVRTHVKLGEEKIQQSGMSPDVAEIASQHHEREDGSGYLQGFKGSEMKVIGACAGIVDTFGADDDEAAVRRRDLAVQRARHHAQVEGQDLQRLVDRGIHPLHRRVPVGSVVELNSRRGRRGDLAEHCAQAAAARARRCAMRTATPVHPHKLLDLSKSPKASADEPYRIRRTLEYGRVRRLAQDLFL
jgi:hypothetical protein